jgi:hypothetical protein
MATFDRQVSRVKGAVLAALLCAFVVGAFLLCSVSASGDPSTPAQPGDEEPEKIAVTDIEIGDYNDKMTTGGTQELTATVLPQDATTQTISYSSSDSAVASVSSKGQVKAVGAGTVVIRMRADEVTREISIEVKVATKAIEVSPNFLVLAPGESAALKVSVLPSDAPQSLNFKAVGTAVASVNGSGVVQAKSAGATSIIVSNGDASAVVTVLVNGRTEPAEDSASGQGDGESSALSEQGAQGAQGAQAESTDAELALIARIESDGGTIRVRQSDVTTVAKAVLKALRDKDATLVVEADSYTLSVRGSDIINEQNELLTHISFEDRRGDVTFQLNYGQRLPGEVEIELIDQGLDREFLYLFNASKDSYQQLDGKAGTVLVLDEQGSYYLTDERLNQLALDPLWVGGALLLVLVGVVAFVVVKRRYWFW